MEHSIFISLVLIDLQICFLFLMALCFSRVASSSISKRWKIGFYGLWLISILISCTMMSRLYSRPIYHIAIAIGALGFIVSTIVIIYKEIKR